MSNRLPSIGVATTVTSPLSQGYIAYLACIATWSKWADQVVIIDGGTTDDSYKVLKNWSSSTNYEAYYLPETYWDLHGCWHEAQWGINEMVGLNLLKTDWAFVIPGDHIIDISTVKGVREELSRNEDSLGVRFLRKKFCDNGTRIKTDNKWYALNLKKIRKERLNVGFGYNNQSNRLTDAPLIINRQTKFVDPVNGVVKKDVAGIEFPISTTLPLTSWSYGFYFYPIEELLKHMREFNCIFSVRYSKRPPKTDKWHLRSQNLDIIHGYLSKKEELKKPHIPAVRELIDAFYHPMMVGAAIRNIQKDQRWKQILRRGVNSINTLRFMMSDFRCIHDVQVWCPLEDESQEPLDVKSLYMQQDPYLPPQLRINWEDVGRRAKKWHSLSPDQPLLPHVKSEIVD